MAHDLCIERVINPTMSESADYIHVGLFIGSDITDIRVQLTLVRLSVKIY